MKWGGARAGVEGKRHQGKWLLCVLSASCTFYTDTNQVAARNCNKKDVEGLQPYDACCPEYGFLHMPYMAAITLKMCVSETIRSPCLLIVTVDQTLIIVRLIYNRLTSHL